MSLEHNKQVVREFLELMPSGAPEFYALVTEDVTCWVPPSVPLGGLYEEKAGVRSFLTDGVDIYASAVPIVATVEHVIAEGDRVADFGQRAHPEGARLRQPLPLGVPPARWSRVRSARVRRHQVRVGHALRAPRGR